ncbi:protein of unknown function DUF121 [Acidimicrobium ferrooxidans DSM 10331]|uniref:2-phospho-L-lactate guanylyltransferase n=1 Tax=Acidimicrobium ferrooxidans (strain DSM 10331 / JCM 15462 / NBRC 103882 / ICP) TaxID=525909 RepID=C7LXT6_ACIFD|nr:hypothetical protein [Acidimicrobium ferrooxidans]ACU53544.1 protein of unknown function DUF121 [Acidimicrobium ferrooxidans DSM 10331]
MQPSVVVVIQRSLERAKSRLADTLSRDERRAFVRACVTHIASASQPASVLVLAEDPSVEELAADLGLAIEHQRGRELNAAIGETVAGLDGRVLVVPADLPFFALPTDLGDVGAVAPDHHLTGTVALWLPEPAAAFPFAFGPDSLRRHMSALRERYGRVQLLGTRFLLDIDTDDDLDLARTLTALDPALHWPDAPCPPIDRAKAPSP